MNPFDATGQNYAEVWAECESLREENRDLRQKLELSTVEISIPPFEVDNATIASATTNSKFTLLLESSAAFSGAIFVPLLRRNQTRFKNEPAIA